MALRKSAIHHFFDALVKSQIWDGKEKSSRSRRRKSRGMQRTYEYVKIRGMQRNADIGLFTKPSTLELSVLTRYGDIPETGAPKGVSGPALIAFLAVLLWLLHPLQTNAVT